MVKNFKYLFFVFLLNISCSTKKDIIYFQGIENFDNNLFENTDYKIRNGDILKISILSENQDTPQFVNNSTNLINNQNRESLMFNGFTVDNTGNINYPQLGKIFVKDLTISEIENKINSSLFDLQILTNHTVVVKVLNWNFTILGEINDPGKYYFNENSVNIMQAIGIAGDLTINGKRNDIKLIRISEEKYDVFNIDLTSPDFINRPEFNIVSGDIIIVNPNTSRVKNAGIIGNSGTLLSLLSFLLSSIIVISR